VTMMTVVMMIVMRLIVMRLVIDRRGSGQPKLRGRHPRPQHTVGGDRAHLERQAPERAPQFLDRQTEIEHRPKHHVA